MDLLDLLALLGTLKNLLQHHSSKASVLQHSAFFIVQLTHPYIGVHTYFRIMVFSEYIEFNLSEEPDSD